MDLAALSEPELWAEFDKAAACVWRGRDKFGSICDLPDDHPYWVADRLMSDIVAEIARRRGITPEQVADEEAGERG